MKNAHNDLTLGPLATQRTSDGIDLYIDLISLHDSLMTGQFVRMRITEELLDRLALMRQACIDFSFNSTEIVMSPTFWDETGDVDVSNWYLVQGSNTFHLRGTSLTSDATVETHPVDLSRLGMALGLAEGQSQSGSQGDATLGADEIQVHGGALFYSAQDVQFLIDAVTSKSREFVAQKLATDMAGAISSQAGPLPTPPGKTSRRRLGV